ncbi:MAG: RagB/SusD family nutrient uptake outer membrane protein [Chitinophagaceae bacterium]|jgi:hypothetical protein|nr:RagB/SusD family nutrient uptake outer membrane protein [Chitinophagaceae bacterium]
MKSFKNWLVVVSTILFSAAIIGSCSKGFLTNLPQGSLSPEVIANKAGVYNLLVGAYHALNGQNTGSGNAWSSSPDNWIYGSLAGGDAHKGSDGSDQPPMNSIATWSIDPSNAFMQDKWRAMYEGVARSNAVIIYTGLATDMTAADKTLMLSEAHFLRGHFYFELKRMFNMVPWISDTTINYKTPNNVDIWPNIEADFQYAVDSLGNTGADVGRANKWAAEAYLAKVYMYEQKFPQAKALFDDVIANGVTSQGAKYGLFAQYEDNFRGETKNGIESVFAVQMSANDGSGGIANANQGDMLNFPYVSPWGCCGFYQPTIDLVNSFQTDPSTGLPLLDTYNDKTFKNDLGITSAAAFAPDSVTTVDPRLDWTAGRRGIPFLDWGLHPGAAYIRDQSYAGPYSPKKNLFWSFNSSTYWDQNSWAPGTGLNVNVIRFADVLLMAAEAEVQGGGTLDQAEAYVNQVRNRAANPAGWVYKYNVDTIPLQGFSTKPAANYFIKPYPAGAFASKGQAYALQAIYFERKLELAMEGHRYFDLARWGTAQTELNKFYAFEGKLLPDVTGGNFTAPKNNFFPIPLGEIDLSTSGTTVTLTQNSGY